MAIVLGVLAALAIISAVGSASKVARQRSGQSVNFAAEAVQKSIETVQKASETPALPPAESSEPQSIEPSAASESIESVPSETQSIEPVPTPSEPVAAEPAAAEPVTVEPDAVTKELVDSILERMPDVPMAASLLVSEVVNPEGNDLGVQLDRPNYPIDPQETPPTHHGNNLLDEIAELDQGDRISQLALALEDPDSSMRASAAYALGDLATRTQGTDRDQIMAILTRLSQDVDPQVRVQAANALGSLGNPVMGE